MSARRVSVDVRGELSSTTYTVGSGEDAYEVEIVQEADGYYWRHTSDYAPHGQGLHGPYADRASRARRRGAVVSAPRLTEALVVGGRVRVRGCPGLGVGTIRAIDPETAPGMVRNAIVDFGPNYPDGRHTETVAVRELLPAGRAALEQKP